MIEHCFVDKDTKWDAKRYLLPLIKKLNPFK